MSCRHCSSAVLRPDESGGDVGRPGVQEDPEKQDDLSAFHEGCGVGDPVRSWRNRSRDGGMFRRWSAPSAGIPV